MCYILEDGEPSRIVDTSGMQRGHSPQVAGANNAYSQRMGGNGDNHMKLSLVLAGTLAAPLCLSTAIADNGTPSSFYALSGLSNSEHVTAMTNDQLDSVKGEGAKKVARINQRASCKNFSCNAVNSKASSGKGGTTNQGGITQQAGIRQ